MKTKHKVILGVSIGATILAAGAGVFTWIWFTPVKRGYPNEFSCRSNSLTFEGHQYNGIIDGKEVPAMEYGEQIGYAINSKDEKKFVKKNPGVRYGITDACTYKVPQELYSVVGDDELKYLRIGASAFSYTLQRID